MTDHRFKIVVFYDYVKYMSRGRTKLDVIRFNICSAMNTIGLNRSWYDVSISKTSLYNILCISTTRSQTRTVVRVRLLSNNVHKFKMRIHDKIKRRRHDVDYL